MFSIVLSKLYIAKTSIYSEIYLKLSFYDLGWLLEYNMLGRIEMVRSRLAEVVSRRASAPQKPIQPPRLDWSFGL